MRILHMKETLKVKAVGDILVQDYRAMRDGVKRYIGREHDASVIKYDEFSDEDNKISHRGGFVSTNSVVEVPNIQEYRKEVELGFLEAADEKTAIICGIKFNKDKQ